MSLQYVFGAPGSGKTEYIIRECIKSASKNLSKQHYIFVPEQDSLMTQQKICNHSMNLGKGILNIDVISFDLLAYRVLKELNKTDVRIIDDMGKIMILRAVSEGIKDDLRLYKSSLGKSGFISKLKSTISEFYQYKIEPLTIRNAALKAENLYLRDKLMDLSLIYEAFTKYMIENGYMCKEELLDRLYEYIPNSDILKGANVYFDGYTGFTPVEMNIISEVLIMADESVFSLDLGRRADDSVYSESDISDLFYLTKDTVKDISKLARDSGVNIKRSIRLNRYKISDGEKRADDEILPRFENAKMLSHLEKNLFNYGEKEKMKADGSLRIIKAENRRSEINMIKKEIKKAVSEGNIRYKDIAIVLCDMDSCKDLIYKSFNEAEIPYFMDDKISLMDSPYTDVLRSALDVLERSFSFDSVMRYLRIFPKLEGYENNEIDIFENYLRKTGISGLKAYSKKWSEYEYLKEKWLGPIIELRENTGIGRIEISKRIDEIRHFFEKAGIEERIGGKITLIESIDRNKAESYRKSYDEIKNLLSKYSELLGDMKVNRKEFRDILDGAFKEVNFTIMPATIDQVLIGDLERSRFDNPKLFFVVGANAGNIPSGKSDDKLIADSERAFFKELEIPHAMDRNESSMIEREYLYKAFLNPSSKLIISYAEKGRDGASLKPSYIIRDISENFEDFSIESAEKYRSDIYLKSEALSYISYSLRDAIENKIKNFPDEEFLLYFRYLMKDKEYSVKLEKILDAAFTRYVNTSLEKMAAEKLYGKVMEGSVSRIEKFNKCAYEHFLEYGLKLSERDTFSLRPLDLGNLYHGAIEKCFNELMEKDMAITDLEEKALDELIEKSVDEEALQYENSKMLKSGRNRYILRKLKEILKLNIKVMGKQIENGSFNPREIEKDFKIKKKDYHLSGRIDRIDSNVTDDKIYLRVIDYKTGKTKFNLKELYEGIQIQLFVYLGELLKLYGKEYSNKEIVPAAAYYYHIDYPELKYKRGRTEDERKKEVYKKLKMNGVTNIESSDDDKAKIHKNGVCSRDELLSLCEYASENVESSVKKIKEGEISKDPMIIDKDHDSCTYCPYHSVCGFDTSLEDFKYRKITSFSDEKILENILEATRGENVEKTRKEDK